MRPNFSSAKDPELKQLMNRLNGILSSLDISNFNSRIVSGITSSSANTAYEVRHGFNSKPSICIPIEGDIYVEKLGDTTVDIRSGRTSITFKALVIQ